MTAPDTDRSPGATGAPTAAARRRPRRPRRPVVGLPLLVVSALLAAFLAWVGAEPFRVAVGHGDRGTLAVTGCTGAGLTRRCVGDFTATGRRYTAGRVTLTGAMDRGHRGARLPARMVDRHGRTAYVGDGVGLTLRWALPLALILLLGLLIAVATGAWRLRGGQRRTAVALSLAGPLLLAAGITLATTR